VDKTLDQRSPPPPALKGTIMVIIFVGYFAKAFSRAIPPIIKLITRKANRIFDENFMCYLLPFPSALHGGCAPANLWIVHIKCFLFLTSLLRYFP
jgi:hypothetical protein